VQILVVTTWNDDKMGVINGKSRGDNAKNASHDFFGEGYTTVVRPDNPRYSAASNDCWARRIDLPEMTKTGCT